jgi:3-deoxy-manno-octulosonate cytidylyltransferase (CMP-KDO synthetase)
MIKILAVIPARYASQRFPGKPLVKIGDRPMVEWVYAAASSCPDFAKVVVATDDQRVADCVTQFGGNLEMTRSDHLTGTDRVAEVASRYPDIDVVVNVQGDQPFVTAAMLSQLVSPYLQEPALNPLPAMTTLACPLNLEQDYTNPHAVKVLCDRLGNALYFSRAPIPHFRNPHQPDSPPPALAELPIYHHLGLYGFARDFLAQYAQLSATPLEQCEGLEQLRVLEHGFNIRVCLTEKAVVEINTPEDLAGIQASIQNAI